MPQELKMANHGGTWKSKIDGLIHFRIQNFNDISLFLPRDNLFVIKLNLWKV